jgi:hypothetical protein
MNDDTHPRVDRYFLGDEFIVERCATTGGLFFFTRIVMERWRSMMMKLSRHKRRSQERERSRDLNAAEAVRQLLLENPEAFAIPEHQDQQCPTPLSDESDSAENDDGSRFPRLTFPDRDEDDDADSEDSVGGFDGVSRRIQRIKNLIDATDEEIHSCATFTKLSLLNAIEILKTLSKEN